MSYWIAKCSIILQLLITGICCDAQSLTCSWLHTFGFDGDNQGNDAITDNDGNFLVVGDFYGTVDVDPSDSEFILHTDHKDAFFAKYSPNNDLIWAYNFAGASNRTINRITVAENNQIIICGNFSQSCDFDFSDNEFILLSNGFQDAFMAVYDGYGSLIYAVSIGGAQGDDTSFAAVEDTQGNFYFTGYFRAVADIDPTNSELLAYEYTGSSIDMFVIKLSQTFDFIWGGTVSGPGFEIASSICIGSDDSILISGLIEGSPDFDLDVGAQYAMLQVAELNVANCFIAKYTLDGTFVQGVIFGGLGEDYITSMLSNSSGFLIGGSYAGYGDFDPGSALLDFETFGESDMFLMQIDNEFNTLWSYNVGGTEHDYISDLATDPFGNIAVAGSFARSIDFDTGTEEYILSVPATEEGDYYDAVVILFSADGQFKEAKNFGGWYFDISKGVAISGNSILTTGYFTLIASLDACTAETENEGYGEDVFILCLSSEYLEINEQSKHIAFVSPNPADKFIHVKFSKLTTSNKDAIKIYNLQGQLINQFILQPNKPTFSIDCSEFENGTYLLNIESEGVVISEKVVVVH